MMTSHHRPWSDTTSCVHTDRTKFAVMGCSVRTSGWRYTAWLHWDGSRLMADFSQPPVGEELYAHAEDDGSSMDAFENVNLADNTTYAPVKEEMHKLAVAHWNVKPNVADRVVGASSSPPEDPELLLQQFEVWDQK